MAPDPRMEAPIRQEHCASSQKGLRTPYQQQVQALVLATHSSGIGRGTILAMMKRSQELECQTTTIGCGRGLSTKSQGAPAQAREAPGQDPPGSNPGKEPVSSPEGICEDTESINSSRQSIPLFQWSPLCSSCSAGSLLP